MNKAHSHPVGQDQALSIQYLVIHFVWRLS